MRSLALLAALGASMILHGCGEGGGTPENPVAPPGPTPQADIVATSGLDFGLCNGPGAGCYYSQDYSNSGSGCANNLHGKIRIFEDDTLLGTDDWWLESSRVLRPGEIATVEDCCFDQDALRRRNRSTVETFWNNVPCR